MCGSQPDGDAREHHVGMVREHCLNHQMCKE